MLFYLLACVALATAAPNKSPYVVGGSDSVEGEFPWQVSLQADGEHYCGGALITENHVITAAHCFSSSTITVALGTLDYHYADQFVGVTSFYSHPQFNPSTYDYDVAVITLESSALTNTVTIGTIGMAAVGSEYTGTAQVTGWGGHEGHDHDHDHVSALSEEEEHDDHLLQKADISLVSATDCQVAWNGFLTITNRMQCVGGDHIIGICTGDIGSPLTVQENGNTILIGVGSWGDDHCHADIPAIYAKVSSVRSWIDSVIQS